MYIDTHTHLFVKHFDADRPAVVQKALSMGVNKMLLPNIDVESLPQLLELSATFPNNCLPMIGLHPSSVDDNYLANLKTLATQLDALPWVAIGETGLDLYWRQDNLQQQTDSLKQQCYWAVEKNLPIVLHSRSANRQTIDLIKKLALKNLKGVFHCFSGTLQEAKEMIDLGFYLGIGGTVTYPKSNIPEIIATIGLQNIVLETDSPYLPPVPHRGKRNESAFLIDIANFLAQKLEMKPDEIATITTLNATKLFNLKHYAV